jgi:hypothetical protein
LKDLIKFKLKTIKIDIISQYKVIKVFFKFSSIIILILINNWEQSIQNILIIF